MTSGIMLWDRVCKLAEYREAYAAANGKSVDFEIKFNRGWVEFHDIPGRQPARYRMRQLEAMTDRLLQQAKEPKP